MHSTLRASKVLCALQALKRAVHQATIMEATNGKRSHNGINSVLAPGGTCAVACQRSRATKVSKRAARRQLGSRINVAPDGTKRQVFGPSPKGIFILDASGHCAQIMFDPSRPKFKGKTRLDGTAEENAAAMRGTSALFGTWSIDEATGTLVTNVNGHVFPNYDGVKLVRKVAISGDQLNVTTLEASSGGTSHLVFRRMK